MQVIAPAIIATSLAVPRSHLAASPGPVLELAQRWEDLSPDQRSRALQNYQRFQKLPERDRERMEQRYQHWQGLDPGEQARIRRNYDRYQQMSPDEKRSFVERYQRWKGGQQR